jgi:hypothetical protein
MNPGHNRRDMLAEDAEDGERILAITYRLTKILGGGVVRREVRLGKAGSLQGFVGAGRAGRVEFQTTYRSRSA